MTEQQDVKQTTSVQKLKALWSRLEDKTLQTTGET
jgi:hypothetical protein